MRTSSHLLAPGFAKRSIDEFKRFARIGKFDNHHIRLNGGESFGLLVSNIIYAKL